MRPDASTVSKSTTQNESGNHLALIHGQSRKVDQIFPLVDHIVKLIKVPISIQYIFAIFLVLQLLATAFWPSHPFYDDSDSTIHMIIQIIWNVFFFCSPHPSWQVFLPSFLVNVLVFVVVIGVLAFQLSYFNSRHRYIKWTLYLTHFFMYLLTPIMILPCSAAIGVSLEGVINTGKTEFWVSLFVSLLVYAGYNGIYYLFYSINSASPYISNDLFSSRYPTLLPEILLFFSITFLGTFIFDQFELWGFVIWQLTSVAICAYLFYTICHFYFFRTVTNALLAGILCAFICSDLVLTVAYWYEALPLYMLFVVAIIVFLIAVIAYTIYEKMTFKKVKGILRDKDGEKLSDDEKFAMYSELGLDKSFTKMVKYFYLGFMQASPYFIDWSLLKFMLNAYTNNTKALCEIIRVLATFPSESRPLNHIFNMLNHRRDLKIQNRFVIYQVYRIKIVRQSSISNDATERQSALKNQTLELEDELRSFWVHDHVPLTFAEVYSKKVEALSARWDEAIRDYPNNSKICQEYSRFLAECSTDFEKAVLMSHRCNLIEGGANFSTDIAYRNMVRMFPVYLKNNILDFRGNIVGTKVVRKGSQNNSTVSSTGSSGSYQSTISTLEIDAEVEETISNSLFKDGRLRMALHKSVGSRSVCSIDYMIGTVLAIAVAVIGISIACFFIIQSDIQVRRNSMSQLNAIAQTRFYTDLNELLVFYRATKDMKLQEGLDPIVQEYRQQDAKDPDSVKTYIDITESAQYGTMPVQIMKYSNDLRDQLATLLQELSSMAADNINIYDTMDYMMNDRLNTTYCDGYRPYEPASSSLRILFTMVAYYQTMLAGPVTYSNWFEQTRYCEMSSQYDAIMEATDSLFETFYLDSKERGLAVENRIFILMLAVTIGVFAVTFVPIMSYIVYFILELRRAFHALESVTQADKEAAMDSVCKDDGSERRGSSELESKTSVLWYISFGWFLMSSVMALFVFGMTYTAYSSCQEITTMNGWLLFATWRIAGCCGTTIRSLQAVVFKPYTHILYTSYDKLIESTKENRDLLENAHNYLMMGYKSIVSSFGYDQQLDDLNTKEKCTADQKETGTHSTYRCASLDRQISIFKDIATQLISTPRTTNTINDDIAYNMMHMSSAHIWTSMTKVMLRLLDLCEEVYQTMISQMMIFLIVSIFVTIFSIVIAERIRAEMKIMYSTVLILIKRLTPHAVIQNKEVIDYILRKSTKNDISSMSSSQSVIYNSMNGIVCTNLNGIIEIVNPAVTNILGYTPEQLLGQQYTTFFASREVDSFAKQLELMKNGEAASTYEERMDLVDDSGIEITCGVTVLAMHGENSQKITSFVLLFQDESDLVAKQKEAEAAKQKSEDLLFQILPRDIVVRLNQGEKDICFTVESATVIFIDIVKFSEYTMMLSPQEIMGNLSLIFAEFDAVCAKYPLLTKIKLIGDVYMAAAGLFSKPEDPPEAHAMQTVQFALECLNRIEEINVRLNASLQVRIGVNSGGPLLGGVLGTDKPVFDIIGDTINVASRLQSTDVPGLVQVSGATKDLLDPNAFDISERGEVYLKGKGNQKTYFVQPISEFMATLSTTDLKKDLQSNQ